MDEFQTTEQDALDRLTSVPPALVEAVQENPDIIRPVARSMATINLHNLFIRMQDPSTPNKDRMEFQQLLHKLGDMEVKSKDQPLSGEGFKIIINIPHVNGITPPAGKVIEAESTDATKALPASVTVGDQEE